MTVLAHKQQPFVWSIGRFGMPTLQTGLAGIVGIDFDRHTFMQHGFVGNHALEFCKAPLGVRSVRFALFARCLLAAFAFGPFSDMGQVF